MNDHIKVLCRDINGDVHIIGKQQLVKRVSIYGVIQNRNGVLLVRDRTRTDEKWDLPGGGVESGERVIDALKREIKEEANLNIIGSPQKICEFIE